MKAFYVYILASASRRLYVGFTSDLAQRVAEHKSAANHGFTARYGITQLVRFEKFTDSLIAIEREKKIKNMPRTRKLKLVERENPGWVELEVD
jgi:putative endonuclease